MDASQDSDTGLSIRYRFKRFIFNLRRLQTKTKVQTDVLDELLYADDMNKKVQVGKDQENVQSEKDFHSNTEVGKKQTKNQD